MNLCALIDYWIDDVDTIDNQWCLYFIRTMIIWYMLCWLVLAWYGLQVLWFLFSYRHEIMCFLTALDNGEIDLVS